MSHPSFPFSAASDITRGPHISFLVKDGTKIKHTNNDASGGKVSHLKSWLALRFNPRPSG